MEKQSGLELDWYREDWVNSTNTINYGIKSVKSNKEGTATHVIIRREGRMAMPLDILVTYEDGSKELFYAPLESMRGAKPASDPKYTLLPDHRWVDLQYEFDIPKSVRNIKSVQIDPARRMADIDLSDNEW
jgi:hypothetical protein